jgi:intraflagellar transport protein 52
MQESEDLPKDFTTLFDLNLFKFDTSNIPVAAQLYAVCLYLFSKWE